MKYRKKALKQTYDRLVAELCSKMLGLEKRATLGEHAEKHQDIRKNIHSD